MVLFIYPADIQRVTGRSLRYCQRLYNQIIDAFGKPKEKGLLKREFAQYHGISLEDLEDALTTKK